jgi:hypothetical protein
MEARPMATEMTLVTLRAALHNVEHLRDLACGEEPPVASIRAIAAHALRDLHEVEREIDRALDEAAGTAVDERYALTPAGTATLVVAGLARDRAALAAGRPDAPVTA